MCRYAGVQMYAPNNKNQHITTVPSSAHLHICISAHLTILRKHMEQPIRNLLKEGTFNVNGSLWLEFGGKRFFGPGPVELLERIAETGSIKQAAKAMGMSYKKAWDLINNLNSMGVRPFVVTSTGGEKGGGSSISEEARQMIAYHRQLRERFRQFLEQESSHLK